MISCKIALALFCLVNLAIILPSHAQDTPGFPCSGLGSIHPILFFTNERAEFNSSQAGQDYLNAHNQARAAVGVGPMTWDNSVAAYAQNYANQRLGDCNLVHSNGRYGENLAWSSGDLTGTDAVKMWVNEEAYYDYNSNSCAAGQLCGHYTQVVWRNSVRLGCAKVRCNNGGTFIGCNYAPPGNYVGQRPY